MSSLDLGLHKEILDNLFHEFVQGLEIIREAAKVGGVRVTFTLDDDHLVVGPYSELFPYLNTPRLESLGFKAPKEGGVDVWVFKATTH